MQHHYGIITLEFFFFLFNILCLKHTMTYFTVNSIINMVFAVVIKYLSEGKKLLSKLMTKSSLLYVPPSKQTDSQVL